MVIMTMTDRKRGSVFDRDGPVFPARAAWVCACATLLVKQATKLVKASKTFLRALKNRPNSPK